MIGIFAPDADFEVIQGKPPYVQVDQRIRITNAILFLETTNQENTFKFSRYFPSSKSYVVDLNYVKNSDQAIIDVYLDTTSTPIFKNLDTYSDVYVTNYKTNTILNISEGFHDIVFSTVGKNAKNKSNYYNLRIQSLSFN